jgi:lipopolysaccharide/colanic/teichoic acid biosynthesis glycosyltransferase
MHDHTAQPTTTEVGPPLGRGRPQTTARRHGAIGTSPAPAVDVPASPPGPTPYADVHGPVVDEADLEALVARLRTRRPGPYERVGKVVIDRVVAAVGLLVVSPLLLVVAGLVLASVGRPILYRQVRAGRDGRPFTMWKFRTMRTDRRYRRQRRDRQRRAGVRGNDRRDGDRRITHKTGDDPRHTRLGRLLRRASLDELPQLWNVLTGDMSVVGPRPELYELTERFTPWQHARHHVRPGITGLWQITERGEGRLLHECIDLDLRYIDELAPMTDLRILLRTPAALLRNRGVI